ncbi:MAG: precorrin-3B C(17)-methyltransferase [Pseudomonadota bacterium]
MAVAEEIKALSDGTIHGLKGRVDACDVSFDDVGEHLAALFVSGTTIVGVMASGALVRMVAPHLRDKHSDPAVIAVADDGSSVVPLVGGHHGGNQIARVIAAHLGGHAAVTTAGDVRFGVALDEPPQGWRLANPKDAKPVMAAMLAGKPVAVDGPLDDPKLWLRRADLPVEEKAEHRLTVTHTATQPGAGELVYYRADTVLGVGCERGAAPEELIALAQDALRAANISHHSLACVASIDVKADEAAVHAVAAHFGVAARFFSAEQLEAQTPRLATPSDIVFAEVGCHGVCEGAALAAGGASAELVLAKQKSKRATVAIARSDDVIDPQGCGRARGHLSVVGIGPGNAEWRSPEVSALVAHATDLVGYSLYLDLLEDLAAGKIRHDFPLGAEEDRVRHAMELAGQGRDVALVCSGDAGIYAMATLVFELFNGGGLSDAAARIDVTVAPGISALQAAAARAGAPLGHDFCTISLSDLLTPWQSIQTRVKAAAEGDFVIAFYNPVSKRRRTQLAYARDVLLQHRPADTPVILASNLGRSGEVVRTVPLGDLNIDDVDMLTVVVVGSSDSRTVTTGSGQTWVYTPRGYSAKEGTQLGQAS